MKMINNELGEGALAVDVLDNVLEMWWPKLNESVEKILKNTVLDRKKSVRPERDILEEILELTRNASIQKDKLGRGREVIMHPSALRDLIEGYRKISTEMESLDTKNILGLTDAIKSFEKPLSYIIRNADIASIDRENLLETYESAKSKLNKIYDYFTVAKVIEEIPKVGKRRNSKSKD